MTLLAFGFGYCARAFAARLGARFSRVAATVRSPEKAAALAREGVEARVFPGPDDARLAADLAEATALVVSVPPRPGGDPVLAAFEPAIAAAPRLRWIAYLSTIGVYGDRGGAVVDASTPPAPTSERSRRRLEAEEAWLALGRASGKPVAIFRLAGIYGPGRSAFDKLRDGTAQRIVKPGHLFNRIHVEDVAAALEASLDRPRPGATYDLADDEPAPAADVVAFAAALLGVEPPPPVPFETAELSPMARSFWSESKRVSNRRTLDALRLRLAHPTYREGLRAILAGGG